MGKVFRLAFELNLSALFWALDIVLAHRWPSPPAGLPSTTVQCTVRQWKVRSRRPPSLFPSSCIMYVWISWIQIQSISPTCTVTEIKQIGGGIDFPPNKVLVCGLRPQVRGFSTVNKTPQVHRGAENFEVLWSFDSTMYNVLISLHWRD